ncbi:MAG TPA: hypothetical protein VMV97_11925 [Sulfuriferula sp.]|nr:hypothetical protein [Sulfuriferula sp.]
MNAASGFWRLCVCAALALHGLAQAAEEPGIAIPELEKKPFEIGGYVELKQEDFRLNRGAPFYELNFPDQSGRRTLDRTTGTLQLNGKYTAGIGTFNFLTNSDITRDQTTHDHDNKFFEAYLSLKPNPGFTLDAGKKTLNWGKGYAWNPVGFIQRPKDPDDPTLAREGYTFVAADFIRSFEGPLQTIAFTPVLLPVSSDVNNDFGKTGHVNVAAKLYFLYRDTDIDLMYLGNGSKTPRFGFDFSRNLGTNMEIHGEWAHISDSQKQVVNAAGQTSLQLANISSYLLGLRYLTEKDTTYIAEYYHNGPGFSDNEATGFYQFVDNAVAQYQTTGNASLLQRAQSLSQGAYGRPNTMQNYLYFRVSQKDAFGIVYFSPAVTLMANLNDKSFSVTPELLYTGINNLELRLRLYLLNGSRVSDFGAKQNSSRLELYARRYF